MATGTNNIIISATLIFLLCTWQVRAQEESEDVPAETELAEGMNNERMQAIIEKVDPEFTGQPGYWNLRVSNVPITIITDSNADRMRIIIPIRKADELDTSEMQRVLQANFDTALDARYAIAKGILWSTFIHPLSSLSDKGFLSGLGQSINIVVTYGETYSSGVFTFGGGDSNELFEKKLLEELMKKGDVI
jgi:hypothetical protein